MPHPALAPAAGLAALLLAGGAATASDISYHARQATNALEYAEPGLMTESGMLSGFSLGLAYAPNPQLTFELDGTVLSGGLDYEGQTWGGKPVLARTDDYVIETQARAVFHVTPGEPTLALSPYVGIGHRYWHQDILTQGGYTREVAWTYLPLGLRLAGQIGGSDWSWQLDAQYRYFMSGDVTSQLTSVGMYEDAKNDVDGGHGHRIAFSARYDLNYGSVEAFTLTPYYETWSIDKSSIDEVDSARGTMGVYEPRNTTRSFGLDIGLTF